MVGSGEIVVIRSPACHFLISARAGSEDTH